MNLITKVHFSADVNFSTETPAQREISSMSKKTKKTKQNKTKQKQTKKKKRWKCKNISTLVEKASILRRIDVGISTVFISASKKR